MTEKNILAYFRSREDAEAVAAKLKALRAVDVSINQFGRYPGDTPEAQHATMTGDIRSLASLTMDAGVTTRDEGVLLAADESASGLSDGGQRGGVDRNFILAAVVKEETHHQALRIVEEEGGLL